MRLRLKYKTKSLYNKKREQLNRDESTEPKKIKKKKLFNFNVIWVKINQKKNQKNQGGQNHESNWYY